MLGKKQSPSMFASPEFFIKGIMIGFAIAAPVGPVGVLCIRRTLLNGMVSGLASGTGAALADAFYGAIAAFGLTFISLFMQEHAPFLQGIGGIFLLYLGIATLLKRPHTAEEIVQAKARAQSVQEVAADFGSTFLLTLTNPATVLSFIAIFAGLGLVSAEEKPDYLLASVMVGGVFLGSFLWWCILSGGIGLFRHRLDDKSLRWISVLSGLIITGFGFLVLAHLALTHIG